MGGGPKAQGLGAEHGLSCGSGSHRGLAAAIRDLQTQRWRDNLQPPTGSSHWLNVATGASGAEACRGHSLSLGPSRAEEGQGMDAGDSRPSPLEQTPVPGMAPGTGDTLAKRTNKA